MTETQSSSEPVSRGWLHVIQRTVITLVLCAGLIGAYVYWERMDHAPKAERAAASAAAPAPTAVDTIVLQPQTVPIRPTYLGQTEASQQVEIRARVKGFLDQRTFVEGQAVKKGQTLFRIDPRTYQAEREMASARLAAIAARLERAQQQVKRYQQLVERQSATSMELEQWQMEERVASADTLAEKARISQAELDLSYTTIVAPLDGVIGRTLKDVGSYVDDGAGGLLAELQQVDPIYVRYSVSEQDILRWRRNIESGKIRSPKVDEMELEISLSDGQKYAHTGRINFVDVQVDPNTGTAVVRGTVPNPEGLLRPGQFIHVALLGIERVDALLVPQGAVLQSPAGASVYIASPRGIVEQRPITLGDWSTNQWIVEKGLKAGEQVIVDRLQQMRPGTAVAPRVRDATATPAPLPVSDTSESRS